jgi:hypothetical protein
VRRSSDRTRDELPYSVSPVSKKVVPAPAITLQQLRFEHDHPPETGRIMDVQYL